MKLPADGRDKQESAGKVKAARVCGQKGPHFIFA
jgi:hypothetical protein